MDELTMSMSFERLLRYWPAREPTPEMPGRAYRIEVLLPCDACHGMLRCYDDNDDYVLCDRCGGCGRVWTPLHWVKRQQRIRGARFDCVVVDDASPNP